MNTSERRRQHLHMNSTAMHADTVECVKNALLTLMQQKPYDEITMTEIIRKSGISRAGVYYTYKSKEDILLDICREPVEEVCSALTDSIFDNMEMTFRIGKKYESTMQIVIAAGLEYEFLRRMNKRLADASNALYVALWNGMIYNAFIEWARAGMPGTVEETIENVKSGLKLVANTIETGLRNNTQDAQA